MTSIFLDLFTWCKWEFPNTGGPLWDRALSIGSDWWYSCSRLADLGTWCWRPGPGFEPSTRLEVTWGSCSVMVLDSIPDKVSISCSIRLTAWNRSSCLRRQWVEVPSCCSISSWTRWARSSSFWRSASLSSEYWKRKTRLVKTCFKNCAKGFCFV